MAAGINRSLYIFWMVCSGHLELIIRETSP